MVTMDAMRSRVRSMPRNAKTSRDTRSAKNTTKVELVVIMVHIAETLPNTGKHASAMMGDTTV